MKLKVKNTLNKDIRIKLLNGTDYLLKVKDEKIVGNYSEDAKPMIFKYLKKELEVSKISEENIKEHMLI